MKSTPAIVHPDMRGDLGMHYTSVPNIMKVLQPLFLMSLEEEFVDALGHREERSRLNKLLMRVSNIRVFDPACGYGNFLIIAYRELRTLEMRIFKGVEKLDGGQHSRRWIGVTLSNFYGIELADFASETAAAADYNFGLFLRWLAELLRTPSRLLAHPALRPSKRFFWRVHGRRLTRLPLVPVYWIVWQIVGRRGLRQRVRSDPFGKTNSDGPDRRCRGGADADAVNPMTPVAGP